MNSVVFRGKGEAPKKESDQIIVNQVKSFKLLERLVRKA